MTPVDDEQFLVDQFEGLLERSVRASRPFLAVICFHGVHIPYVATPATRATYAKDNHTLNEQDYYGTITQIDAAVGRVRRRRLLRGQGPLGFRDARRARRPRDAVAAAVDDGAGEAIEREGL